MAGKNTADIGFEKQIWDAACVLRGNMDASEYKNVVLGLIFLKYISDRFDEKYQALIEEGDGFEEDVDEYTSEGIFFVPVGARWSEIAANAHTPEIGTIIDDAMRAIEKENKRLKDILPKNFARPELDKRRLVDVVDLFTNIQMVEHGSEKDILGRTYEYCLSMFAEQEGKRGGEFFTPKTSKPEYWNGDIPWLSVKDFNNDYRYVYRTEKSITKEGLENSTTKLLDKGDMIISARGTVGEVASVPYPMAFNQSCYGLRAKSDLIVSDFLYYLIKYNVNVLKKQTHGSVFDTITRNTFDDIEVDIPDFDCQKKIASLLSDLDAKIELNIKINENLAGEYETFSVK